MLPLLAGTADAGVGVQLVSYSKTWMKTALRAVGYPRPHIQKLTCTGLGAPVYGRYWSFRCVARWRHDPGRKVLYAAGSGYGGWICAGSSVAGCHVLRRATVSLNRRGQEATCRTTTACKTCLRRVVGVTGESRTGASRSRTQRLRRSNSASPPLQRTSAVPASSWSARPSAAAKHPHLSGPGTEETMFRYRVHLEDGSDGAKPPTRR